MLISHSKKFIFIHNYKVAGTSVRKALDKYADRSFLRSSITSKFNVLLGKYPNIYSDKYGVHPTSIEVQSFLPTNIFDSYYKLGFVRNPWDWEVSLYIYMLKKTTHPQHELIKKMKSFEEYIDWRINEDLHFQKEFFYDVEGKRLVDFIGKFEDLNEDFDKICVKLNITDIKLPHVNKSQTKKYLKYYTPSTIDLVFEALKPDIELFGYEKPILTKGL